MFSAPVKNNPKPKKVRFALRNKFSSIGIDIGSSHIKLAQLMQTSGGPEIYRYAAIPTPKEYLQGGKDGDLSILSKALKDIITKEGFRKDRVQLSLNSQFVTLRRLTLPLLTPLETATAIRWEAEKHLPLPPGATVYDYAFLERRLVEGKEVQDFILAAAPKAAAQKCTEAVLKAGLYPQGIEIALFALRRSVNYCSPERPQPCLVVNMGAECCDLLILQRGQYRFYRTLNLGANHLTLGDITTARSQPDLNTQSKTAIQFARQITQSLEFYAYETQYPEKHCTEILLTGGGAMIPGLDSFLQNELRIRTRLYNPLAATCFKTFNRDGEAKTDTGPLYPISIGLALRGWIR